MINNGWQLLARIVIAVAIAALTIWYTVLCVLRNVHPLDATNLGLIAIAVISIALLVYPRILTRLHSIEGGGFRIELLEREQQQQRKQLDEFALILPILLPPTERHHILNLASGNTAYTGNKNLQDELRRLRSIGLIKNTQPIASIKDGVASDLASVVQLTPLGREWADKLVQYEREAAAEGQRNQP